MRIQNQLNYHGPQVQPGLVYCRRPCPSWERDRKELLAGERARITMMYARGLNEREVHTRSWHYIHEWLEQYLRYDFLIPIPNRV